MLFYAELQCCLGVEGAWELGNSVYTCQRSTQKVFYLRKEAVQALGLRLKVVLSVRMSSNALVVCLMATAI